MLVLYEIDIDFKVYFIIIDFNGNFIEVLEFMIDSLNVNLNEVGIYNLVLNY